MSWMLSQVTVEVLQEQLQVSRRREEALQQQVELQLEEESGEGGGHGWSDCLLSQLSRLLQELKEARDAQSPEVKLLCSLERKLVNMEVRLQSREQELQQVLVAPETAAVPAPLTSGPVPLSWQLIGGSGQRSDERSELECWRRVAKDKSRQLETFRQELDSILDMLRCLQREGVLVSAPAASSSLRLPAGLLKEL